MQVSGILFTKSVCFISQLSQATRAFQKLFQPEKNLYEVVCLRCRAKALILI